MKHREDTMGRRAPARLAWIAAAVLGAGCGGSSSETPWPEEPVRRIEDPNSEGASPRDTDADAGTPSEPEGSDGTKTEPR